MEKSEWSYPITYAQPLKGLRLHLVQLLARVLLGQQSFRLLLQLKVQLSVQLKARLLIQLLVQPEIRQLLPLIIQPLVRLQVQLQVLSEAQLVVPLLIPHIVRLRIQLLIPRQIARLQAQQHLHQKFQLPVRQTNQLLVLL